MNFNHGSLINCLADSSPNKLEPAPGDGATIICWTDRHAATVQSVRRTRSGKLVIIVTRDNAKRVDKLGMTDSGQKYEFESNPNGPRYEFRERKDGVLREGGFGSRTLVVGLRDEHYDFSF